MSINNSITIMSFSLGVAVTMFCNLFCRRRQMYWLINICSIVGDIFGWRWWWCWGTGWRRCYFMYSGCIYSIYSSSEKFLLFQQGVPLKPLLFLRYAEVNLAFPICITIMCCQTIITFNTILANTTRAPKESKNESGYFKI